MTFLGVTVMPESANLVASMASLSLSFADGRSDRFSNDSTNSSSCLAFDWNRRGRGPTRILLREVDGLYGLSDGRLDASGETEWPDDEPEVDRCWSDCWRR